MHLGSTGHDFDCIVSSSKRPVLQVCERLQSYSEMAILRETCQGASDAPLSGRKSLSAPAKLPLQNQKQDTGRRCNTQCYFPARLSMIACECANVCAQVYVLRVAVALLQQLLQGPQQSSLL